MALHNIQYNFVGGTFTQKLEGRADLKKYATGALCLRNMVVQPQGGATRRAGLLWCGWSKDPTRKVRLKRFEFSNSITYMMEFGHEYIRFWTSRALLRAASSTPALTLTLSTASGPTVAATATTSAPYWTNTNTDRGREITVGAGVARVLSVTSTTVAVVELLVDFSGTSHGSGAWTVTGTPVEVTTTYTEAELPYLRFAQSNDVVYIAHRDHAPAKLSRVTATSFTLSDIAFDPAPSSEQGILVDTSTNNVTLSAATVGSSRTLTFASGVLLAGDVGRTIKHSAGVANITAVAGPTSATVDITTAFSGTSLTTGTLTIGLSPTSALVFGLSKDQEGAVVAVVPVNISSGNEVGITSFPSDVGWPTEDAFRSGDVGKLIVGAGGVAKIISFQNARLVHAKILRGFKNVVQNNLNAVQDGYPDRGPWRIPSGTWTLEADAWSSTRGYPGVVFFTDQRLGWAGTATDPDKFWLSVVGDYEDHTPGPNADDSVAYRVASGKVNMIRWGAMSETLLLGTLGAEFAVQGGGDDSPITPTSVRAKEQATFGSSDTVDAVKTGDRVVYLQAGDRRLREMIFDLNTNKHASGDLSLIADNLFSTGTVRYTTYVGSPDPFLLAVRSDGALLACAFEPREEIRAWSDFVTGPTQDYTDGVFESIDAMPNACGTGEEVWVSVKRVISSVTHRFIEVFDGALNTDAARYYSGSAVTTVRGFGYINGAQVRAIGAGTTGYTVTVTNGAVTILTAATTIEAGLYYGSKVTSLRPVVQSLDGAPSLARLLRIGEVGILWYNTRGSDATPQGILVNSEIQTFDPEVSFPFTGLTRVSEYGVDRNGRVSIEQTEPFPMTVSAIIIALHVEEQ